MNFFEELYDLLNFYTNFKTKDKFALILDKHLLNQRLIDLLLKC